MAECVPKNLVDGQAGGQTWQSADMGAANSTNNNAREARPHNAGKGAQPAAALETASDVEAPCTWDVMGAEGNRRLRLTFQGAGAGAVADGGAMVYKSLSVEFRASLAGGTASSIARSFLTDDNLFFNTFECVSDGGGFAVFAPEMPSDIVELRFGSEEDGGFVVSLAPSWRARSASACRPGSPSNEASRAATSPRRRSKARQGRRCGSGPTARRSGSC